MIFRNMKKTLLFAAIFGSTVAFGQTTILSEDFQSGIPATWTMLDLDGQTPDSSVSEYTAAYISKLDPADTNTANLTASSTSYFSPVGTANRWLISPAIALGAYGNFFEWKAKSHDPSYPEDYLVMVSTTDTQEASFTDTIGFVLQEFADWTTRTVDLSSQGFDNQTIYVAFILQTDDGFKFYLDDVVATKDDPVGLKENGIQDLSLKTIENGLFEINTEVAFDQVRVLDNMGRVVLETTNLTIDLRAENSGIYFVQAIRGNELFVSKVVK